MYAAFLAAFYFIPFTIFFFPHPLRINFVESERNVHVSESKLDRISGAERDRISGADIFVISSQNEL